ncbi:hypothetical protein ACHQM5_019814 [Ranunculus cassubicifolius]
MFTTQQTSDHDSFLHCPLPPRPTAIERRWKPNVEIAPNCPRCNSSNTKFCYYNNYSLTQPRYFCKACRRYWTKGGSLRNVPIGGGCRKNRRSRSVPVSSNRVGNSQSAISQPEVHQDSTPRSDSNSTIDLAVVYAKFLNQQPADSSPGLVVLDNIPGEFDPSYDLLSLSDTTTDPSPENHLSDGPNQIFLDEYELNYEEPVSSSVSSYGLQPLPSSENLVVQDMFWSDSPTVGLNYAWQATELQEYDPVITDHHSTLHSNSLDDDNWGSFDIANFEAFSRP